METIEYRTADKSTWGAGPWQAEPDKKQWQDPVTGLPCLIVRNRMGALCGYVGVPKTHPWHGKHYDHDGPIYMEVHGGLTFSESCQHDSQDVSDTICHIPGEGEPDDVWWFGFDCAHAFDMSPGTRAVYREFAKIKPEFRETEYDRKEVYRDLAYVAEEVASLARQLSQVTP